MGNFVLGFVQIFSFLCV
uniref:Uncharacterized protein n=1 Tax=Rhizophora mucronata TaxID=61149 RepID=A0A2P2MRX1_RHIMU